MKLVNKNIVYQTHHGFVDAIGKWAFILYYDTRIGVAQTVDQFWTPMVIGHRL